METVEEGKGLVEELCTDLGELLASTELCIHYLSPVNASIVHAVRFRQRHSLRRTSERLAYRTEEFFLQVHEPRTSPWFFRHGRWDRGSAGVREESTVVRW